MPENSADLYERRQFWRSVRRRIVFSLLVLLIGAGLVFRWLFVMDAEARYQEVVAQAERLDPGWRFEELLANRQKVPEEKNAARRVEAAAALLPKGWGKWPPRRSGKAQLDGGGEPDAEGTVDSTYLWNDIADLPPNQKLDSELARDLRAALHSVPGALHEARRLKGFSTGQYEVAWQEWPLATLLRHHEKIDSVGELLALDAVEAADRGDATAAIDACQSLLNTGRSLGDEPALGAMRVRRRWADVCIDSLERVLGQFAPDINTQPLQELLADEAAQPLFLIGMRGERAMSVQSLEMFIAGEIDVESVRRGILKGDLTPHPPEGLTALYYWLYRRPVVRSLTADFIEQSGELIERLKGSPRQQRVGAPPLPDGLYCMGLGPGFDIVDYLLTHSDARYLHFFQRVQARLLTAQTALAAERFRVDHRRWPHSLQELAPRYLARIPDDPFSDGPLRYRRADDGVVIYSLGHNEKDDGGSVRVQPPESGHPLDIGFRLYDPEHRGKPAARRHRAVD